MLSSLTNRAIFFLEYFYLMNHRKRKHVPSFSFPRLEGIPSLLFMFSWLRFTMSLFKNFSLKLLISLKRHTFNFKHYVHKTCLHKRFILVQIKITKNKKKYFEKFIKELDFVELSTQIKHLRVCVLHGDWLNDNPRYYCQFLHF